MNVLLFVMTINPLSTFVDIILFTFYKTYLHKKLIRKYDRLIGNKYPSSVSLLYN